MVTSNAGSVTNAVIRLKPERGSILSILALRCGKNFVQIFGSIPNPSIDFGDADDRMVANVDVVGGRICRIGVERIGPIKINSSTNIIK
ncbi:hypothetical protein QR98_0050380 [Sarcoptes scabiei]|uniref:Uncharacterized protein n=1 Tax=Sarcoptes scabiei TaxID=52283 RepID=A0A132A6G4_SARSC|nr:hypothetical protein QR98_0050380 [Sarcoptes scabiei]